MSQDRAREGVGDMYRSSGHLYVMSGRYLHMHIYLVDESAARYASRILKARCTQHVGAWDVAVSKRDVLSHAARLLLAYDLPEGMKRELRLAVKYAESADREERQRIVQKLLSDREIMKGDAVVTPEKRR